MLLTSAPAPGSRLPALGITTEVVRDVNALTNLRAEWNELLDASASRTPFLTWEWLQAWWGQLRGSASLHVITVRDGRELIGIAPLLAGRRGLPFASSLEFLGTGQAGSDYLDIIVRKGRERDAIDAIAHSLDAEQLALHLDHLPPSSASAQLRQALAASGWTAIESSPDVCPYISLAGHNWDSFLATLGSSHRANVRRRLRALEADFTVRFALTATHEERRAALETLMAFHDRRFNERGTAFSTPSLRAFHQDATRKAQDAGWLRMYALSLNGDLAAVMYGFLRDRTFYFYQHGFSDAYASYGVGLALMGLTIRAAIDEGATEFDLLYGHEGYKKLWARESRALGRLQLFPPHIGGSLLRRQAETRLALRSFAHQLGLKSRHEHQ